MSTFKHFRCLLFLTALLSFSVMKSADIRMQVGNFTFPYATEVEITSSWEELTDRATITVPRKLSFGGETITRGEGLFKIGDQVRIELGYDGNYVSRFSGYLTRIYPGTPLRFEAEDAMWLLKRNSLTKSYPKVTLQQLLADISPIPFQAATVQMGQFRLDRVTPAQALEHLRKEYGIQSWVRDGKLYSGLAYWPELRRERSFGFELNIISDSLEYQRQEDLRLKVQAISIQPDNSKKEVTVGDPDGEARTIYYYNLSEADLKALAERDLERFRYTGYKGSFTAFGEPDVQHGDLISLTDNRYGDRNGRYLTKQVVTSYGMGGIRQSITLDTLA